ncbi:MAG: hypothetical protein QOE70_1684 [Chthoniobacter sp.]|jgi:hypothetical protein|nr:hypothetical protein [Chthoniobacter sp.]
MKSPLLIVLLTGSLAAIASAAEGKGLGYQDTPIIPGTKWHVHDGERPQPPIVTPGQPSTPEQVGTAPSDAIVLMDGKDLSKWRTAKGEEAGWKVENGYVEVVPKSGDIFTKDEFGPDVQLHVEFATPPPVGDGQGRGNSGVFLFGRYELQVLNSYENPTYPDGQATAIYGYMPPQVNASRKPGEWQTYDIIFDGPRFKDGKLEKPAYVTIFHNGVVTQNHTALIGDTPHKQVGTYKPHAEKGPIKLQDHGNPMRFRNLWIRELKNPGPEDIGDGPKIGS